MKKMLLRNKFLVRCIKLKNIYYWKFIMQFWNFKPENTGVERTNFRFSIGIVTYVDRYNNFFKPLITNLITIFPDTEFVISVNGYYDKTVQEKYLDEIKLFLSGFKNVKIIDFIEPQSLSKLWNLLILNASSDKILILNDDLKISTLFRKNLNRSGILDEEIALINRSWSHFLISKKIVGNLGWFDQRFPGVGNEDEDYECRLVHNNTIIKTFKIKGLNNVVFQTSNFSYGKDIDTIHTKYVRRNKDFFDSKWELSEMGSSSSKYVKIVDCYAKLRKGMETPEFYDLDLLKHSNSNIIK